MQPPKPILPTDEPQLRTETCEFLTYIARTIVKQELAMTGEDVSRRAYWFLAEFMRITADAVERDVGSRSEYVKQKGVDMTDPPNECEDGGPHFWRYDGQLPGSTIRDFCIGCHQYRYVDVNEALDALESTEDLEN